MPSTRVWNGSSWVTIPNGTKVRYWNGSSWVNPKTVRVWNGSSWVTVWSKADPITRTYYADFSTQIRWNGSSAVYNHSGSSADSKLSDMYIGRYGGSFPYHYTSVLGFGNSTNNFSIAQSLAVRPTVKSATLRLYRLSGSGLYSPSGTIRAGAWTQANFRNLPDTLLNGTYHDWDPQASRPMSGWITNSAQTFTLNPQHIYDLNDGKGLMLSEVISGYTTSGATTGAYSKFAGVASGQNNAGIRPMLTVVYDYS